MHKSYQHELFNRDTKSIALWLLFHCQDESPDSKRMMGKLLQCSS